VRAFVAGASGVLGRRIVRQLVVRGHSVVGLCRSDASEATVRSIGGEPRRADLFDAVALAKAAEGCDVIIRAATAIPTKVRTGPKDWAMNDRIRREGTRSLVSAAARVGARAFLQESVVWAVGTLAGTPFDEDAPPAGDAILQSALDAERIAREAGASRGFDTLTLRCGGFYSADGWHTRILAESIAKGRPVLIGRNGPVWSLIHSDDAASAFVTAAQAPKTGVWHIVDDQPVALAAFLGEMAKRLGARPPRRMPRWLARMFLGRYGTRLLSSSFSTSNARFRREFGWRPSFPTCREGLEEIATVWKAEGFPRRKT
jgi:nucleoside-diphosphate-sugar epimerase